MSEDIAARIRPVAEPVIFESAYTSDQHARLIDVVRRNGPWKTILSQHFASAEEVVATLSGSMPEGVKVTFDMFLTPTFRAVSGRFESRGIPFGANF